MKSEGEEREGCESLRKMFVHAVTGSVSVNREKHMQHGGMRPAFHFPLKTACATCAHACVCVHVKQRGPHSLFPFLSNPYGIVFHYQIIVMSLSFHPLSHQVSLAVIDCETNLKGKVHIHQRGCALLVICCKTTHG